MAESQPCATAVSKEETRGVEREVAGVPETEKGACMVIEVVSGSDPETEKVCRICHLSEDLGKGGTGAPETEKGASVVVEVVGRSDQEVEKVCRMCHLSDDLGKEGTGVPETEKSARVVVEVVGGSDPEAEKVCRMCHLSADLGKEETGVPETENGVLVVIDVVGGSDPEAEKICRICHLSADLGKEGADLIQIGCGCKGELAVAHRHCAEAWFTVKGSRCCEICGANAKNITGVGDSKFMEKWHEGRSPLTNINSPQSNRRSWKRQMFCNILMVCLVTGFILPWLFRADTF